MGPRFLRDEHPCTSWDIAVWIQSLVFCGVLECRLVHQWFNPITSAEIGEILGMFRCVRVRNTQLVGACSLGLIHLPVAQMPSWSLAVWSDSCDSRLGLASSGKTKQNGEEGSSTWTWSLQSVQKDLRCRDHFQLRRYDPVIVLMMVVYIYIYMYIYIYICNRYMYM